MKQSECKSFRCPAILICLFCSVMGAWAQLPVLQRDNDIYLGSINPTKAENLHKVLFNDNESPLKNTDKPVTLDFYRTYKELYDLAPYCSYNFYSGYMFNGDKSVFLRLLNGTTDVATKVVLVNDLLNMCHNMVENLDSINVLRHAQVPNLKEGDTISLPVAMTRYAHYYYMLAGNPKYYPKKLYDKELARENFRSAFHMLRARNANPGQELEGIYISEYYRTCEELYKSDEERYYEQFLQDYLEIVQACDNLLIPYYDIPDSIKNVESNTAFSQFQGFNYYTNHQEDGIKALFKKSGAATKERLCVYYDNRLKDNRRDTAYLNRAINLMFENDCSQTETFFSYCDASYSIKPTFLNCLGCANASKKDNMKQEMINYYLEAKKLATSDFLKGYIAYLIAKEAYGPRPINKETNKPYGVGTEEYKKWEDNTTLATANFQQVIQYQDAFRNSSSIAIRQIPANAALKLGDIHYIMAVAMSSVKECSTALAYYGMAKMAAPDLYGNVAQKQIEKVKVTQANLETTNKQNAAKQAAYDAYIRKKKAEDAFWNQ